MGFWGVTMRQSDYGLDLLDMVVEDQLEKVDFKYFHVAEAIELLRQKILEEIERANRGCTPEELEFYMEYSFQIDFEQAVLLVAECLADYYGKGELVVYDDASEYTGEPERHIREVIVTDEDLRLLLTEMRKSLSPESDLFKSWEESDQFDKWQAHVKALCQTLEQQVGA